MSYSILQFNLGTGTVQGYVLKGEGEHEGTNESISFRDAMAYAATGEQLASYFDQRFLRRHRERMLLVSIAEELDCSVDEAHAIRETMAVLSMFAMAVNETGTNDRDSNTTKDKPFSGGHENGPK